MTLEDVVQMSTEKSLTTARRMLLAQMETGNHSDARTLMREIAAVNLEAAQILRTEVIQSHNTDLL